MTHREVRPRASAMTGSGNATTGVAYSFGPFLLFPDRQVLLRDRMTIRIGARAFDLLTALVERPGVVVTKPELVARAWPDTFVQDGNLKVNIASLRRTLGRGSGDEQYIATVIGQGYRFVAPVQREMVSPAAVIWIPLDTLPSGPEQIFGRTAEIESACRELRASRLVSVVGAGGVGKSTVAVAAARAASRERGGGVAFIDFSSIGAPQFIVPAIGSALGVAVTGTDLLASILDVVDGRRLLIVMDNCEHLLPSLSATVDRLVRQLSDMWILTTSREPLGIDGECVLRLDGLECEAREHPSAVEAKSFAAIELFAQRALERSGFQLTDGNAPTIAAICRRLDGNALAIELAATQTAQFEPPRILRLLDDSIRTLNLGPSGAPLRQQSLLATLDWSYRLLAELEASVLRAVSAFASRFSATDAATICGINLRDARSALTQLAAKSLVVVEASAEAISYRLLETTRSYCLGRLRVSKDHDDVRRRHADFVCALLDQATIDWPHLPASEWSFAYTPCLDELRSALVWAAGRESERSVFVKLADCGDLLWTNFSLTEECLLNASCALDKLIGTEFAGTMVEMRLRTSRVEAMFYLRGTSAAVNQHAQHALQLAQQLGDLDNQLRCFHNLILQNMLAGTLATAKQLAKVFISIAPPADVTAVALSYSALSIISLWTGDIRGARQHIAYALSQRQAGLHHSRMARYGLDIRTVMISVLAQVQSLAGEPDAAASTAQRGLEDAMTSEHNYNLTLIYVLASACCLTSLIHRRFDALERDLPLLEAALARQDGEAWWSPWAEFFRGVSSCVQSSQSSEGLTSVERALSRMAANHKQRLPYFMGVYAELLGERDRHAEALSITQEALELAQEARWCVPELQRVRANILSAQGRTEDAEALLWKSVIDAEKMGALSWQLRSANDLATLWRERSRADDAYALLRPIYDSFTEGFGTEDLSLASQLLASLNPSEIETSSK